MSLSWRERVVAFVGPTEVRLRRHARGWRRGAHPEQRIACAPGLPAAQGCVQALRQGLRALQGRAFDARIVLSNHLVRYALVPQGDALRGQEERAAAGRHALHATFGELSQHWEVAIDQSGSWPQLLAAGIEASLLQAITAASRDAGARELRIEPLLVVASQRAERALGPRTGWLAVSEPGRLVLATVTADNLLAVRSHRLRGELAEELPMLLDQSRLVDDADASRGELLLAGEAVPVELAAADTVFRCVPVAMDFTAPGGH